MHIDFSLGDCFSCFQQPAVQECGRHCLSSTVETVIETVFPILGAIAASTIYHPLALPLVVFSATIIVTRGAKRFFAQRGHADRIIEKVEELKPKFRKVLLIGMAALIIFASYSLLLSSLTSFGLGTFTGLVLESQHKHEQEQ